MSITKNPKKLIETLKPAVGSLAQMPVEMWHLWVIWVLEKLREHMEDKQEYEDFLTRLTLALTGRTKNEIEAYW